MIYKRGDFWHYKFMHQGKPVRGSTGTSNVKKARQVETMKKEELRTGLGPDPRSTPTLKDFAQDFLKLTQARGKRDYVRSLTTS